MFYRKPVVIEAFKWLGGTEQEEEPEWIVEAIKSGKVNFSQPGTPNCKMLINTLEGIMTADLGDYIIQGIKKGIYPCKPDIFEQTYEKVNG